MEESPLIKAHDHAKAASEATAANSTVAVNEHTRAAGEFANAAKTTTSVEALRTLKLLEEHHLRLSELLKLSTNQPKAKSSGDDAHCIAEKDETALGNTGGHDILSPAADASPGLAGEKNPQNLPTLQKQPRYPARNLGASIANNLASARGIRSKYRTQPLSPSISNAEAPGNVELAPRRSGTGSKSKMQNMLSQEEKPTYFSAITGNPEPLSRQDSGSSTESSQPHERSTSPSDDGFSRFYSAFGSIINKISAPLAFAGLPLISEESVEEPKEPAPPPEPSVPQRRNRHSRTLPYRASSSASIDPDLSRLYSKATLRAIARDGQSVADSFCVVPPSGHTMSYAGILSFADKEKRRMEASIHGDYRGYPVDDDEDDFVDARESQAPSSPSFRRRSGHLRSDKEASNMIEELCLENKSLKDALDKLSKRLHAFESMSQTSGMRLAESMRLSMHPGSPLTLPPNPNPNPKYISNDDSQLRKKNQELEDQVNILTSNYEDLQRDHNKAKNNLIRYREKWDQLKAGAKARRAGGAQGSLENTTDDGLKSSGLGG